MKARRHWILACVLPIAVGLSACGSHNSRAADANNNGTYVNAGGVTYQLQVSRQLNAYGTEDSQYLTGLPSGPLTLSPDQLWYGVFLWAQNKTNRPRTTTSNFDIVDTQDNVYYPVLVHTTDNPYVWTSQTLPPDATEPGLDTTASYGPTQGKVVLFKLSTTVYNNRPLTLQIRGPQQQLWGTISLDL